MSELIDRLRTELRPLYGTFISETISRLKRGQISLGTDQCRESQLIQNEREICFRKGLVGTLSLDVDTKKIVDLREDFLLEKLYDSIKGLDMKVLDKIWEIVDDPILEYAIDEVREAGSLENITREHFVGNISQRVETYFPETRRVISYVRAIILLELLKEDPSLSDRLTETSSKNLRGLLCKPKLTKTWKEIDREIAEVVIDLYSPKLIEICDRVNDFLESRNSTVGPRRPVGDGPYALSQAFQLFFKEGVHKEKVSEWLESGNALETEKDIYETISRVLGATSSIPMSYGKSIRTQGSEFFTKPKKYANISQYIYKYFINETLSNFSRTGELRLSSLAKRRHIDMRREGNIAYFEVLQVDQDVEVSLNPITYFNTTHCLPTLVYYLKEQLDLAREILSEETQEFHN